LGAIPDASPIGYETAPNFTTTAEKEYLMRLKWITVLPAVGALLLFPSITPAQSLASDSIGVVMLTHPVDAKKLSSGATIPMKLTHPVTFSNGTKLPAGTMLDATVVQDDMQLDGKFKLALRFTDAKTKDGKTIPVKATILAVAAEAIPGPNGPDMGETTLAVPDNLNNQPDVVDSEGIAPGVDLHSKASDQNSGVLVTKKDNIKLPYGTKMELALALGN
jgi:hypothetical protein